MIRTQQRHPSGRNLALTSRRGVFLVIAALCLTACLTLAAFSIDLGIISLSKTEMQNAVDAAALAGAMEITNALANAGADVSDVFAYAKVQAAEKAVTVAKLNAAYVDPGSDVKFGHMTLNESTGAFETDWNASSDKVNAIKVISRRTSDDENSPNAKVPTVFSGVFGYKGAALRVEAVAVVEPRDMVVVHDFSRSMNYDSYFSDEISTPLPQATIEANLLTVFQDLQPLNVGTMDFTPKYAWKTKSNTGAKATVTFKGTSIGVTTNTKIKSVTLQFEGGSTQTFSISNETTTSGTWAGTSYNSGKRISSADVTIRKVGSTSSNWSLIDFNYDTSTILACFGLSSVSYPYNSGSWSDYVSYVKSEEGHADYGYRDMYGGMTFVCYLLKEESSFDETEELWRTRHYPFHAIKEGHELLCDYLSDLNFDDRLGMVSYDNGHRVETKLNSSDHPDFPSVDISSEPLTDNFDAVKKLMHYKQASHYSDATNMAGGLQDAVKLLDQHKREGSRPAIILMTDGNGNTLDSDSDDTLPSGWDWDTLFDYDGDGAGDFSTSNKHATVVLKSVQEAVSKGYTVHAISVGNDADRSLLEAVAWLGGGYWVDVPGGQSASDMEEELKAAFAKIASAVPPVRLVKSTD